MFRAHIVTPFVGVWIETVDGDLSLILANVTPFVGVWIETAASFYNRPEYRSHPSWVCGLKLSFGILSS